LRKNIIQKKEAYRLALDQLNINYPSKPKLRPFIDKIRVFINDTEEERKKVPDSLNHQLKIVKEIRKLILTFIVQTEPDVKVFYEIMINAERTEHSILDMERHFIRTRKYMLNSSENLKIHVGKLKETLNKIKETDLKHWLRF
jgi:hypothetical protein